MEQSVKDRKYSRSSESAEHARKYERVNNHNHFETKKSQFNYNDIKDRRSHSSRHHSHYQGYDAFEHSSNRGDNTNHKFKNEKFGDYRRHKDDVKHPKEDKLHRVGHREQFLSKNEKEFFGSAQNRSSVQKHGRKDTCLTSANADDMIGEALVKKAKIEKSVLDESKVDNDADQELEKQLQMLSKVEVDEEELRERRRQEWARKIQCSNDSVENAQDAAENITHQTRSDLEEGELIDAKEEINNNFAKPLLDSIKPTKSNPLAAVELPGQNSNDNTAAKSPLNNILLSNQTNFNSNQEHNLITKISNSARVDLGEEDDMFSESFNHGKQDVEVVQVVANMKSKMVEATDDDEGYYNYSVGEILHDRYEVLGYFGKGVYSNVLRARDLLVAGTKNVVKKENLDPVKPALKDPSIVAIKLLRNNAHMERAGRKEISICRKLSNRDPENKFHCIRLLDSFKDRQHLCLVFESMDLNLRQTIKKFGHNVGLSIPAVRSYAFQLFNALVLLKEANVIHADLKPDNILVSEDKSTVKLGDFGSAFESHEYELTTELVSRYYRAPEIILGYGCSFAIDMFSMGCSLYELATGRYLFPSNNDNHHLQLIMEVKGLFHKKMLQNCYPEFVNKHFSPDGQFLLHQVDPINPSKLLLKKIDVPTKPIRNITQEIEFSYGGAIKTVVDREMVQKLAELINFCITLDPNKRITPEKALKHPLFSLS